jgi:hypothetical protein
MSPYLPAGSFRHPHRGGWIARASWAAPSAAREFSGQEFSEFSGQNLVVRRDWNFARSGKPAAIFQKLYRSEGPRKKILTDRATEARLRPVADSRFPK